MKKILILLFVFQTTNLMAQFGNVWMFKNGLKLDFNNDTMVFYPAQVSGITAEALAVICDSSGQLLYYSDGITVRDSNLTILPNGDSLGGCSSSTQGALFIPHPGDANLFYLFTVDANYINFSIGCGGNQSLSWALIDKTLNGGTGAVVSKRNVLLNPVKEKLTATRHCNGVDWWVVSHQWGNNSFFSYRVGPNGLDTLPVISQIGVNYVDSLDTVAFTASVGDLKISPNGKILCSLLSGSEYFEMFEFNNETGQVFNRFYSALLPPDSTGTPSAPYACTFSKSSETFYYQVFNGIRNELIQLSITSLDSLNIINSLDKIHSDSSNFRPSTLLQLTPNNWVSVGSVKVSNGHKYLDRISFPDLPYPDCEASYFQMDLNPTGFITLYLSHGPNFPDCIFAGEHEALLHIPTCNGSDSLLMVFDTLLNVVHDITWDFGDPASGANNSYEGSEPYHLFSAPGNYTISLTFTNRCNVFTVQREVFIPNTTAPAQPLITLNAAYLEASASANYQWYLNGNAIAGATTFLLVPVQNGSYTVSTTENGCTVFSDPYQLLNVGISNLSGSEHFIVWQTEEKLQLQCNTVTTCIESISLLDLHGRTLTGLNYAPATRSAELPVHTLSSGMYLLRINDMELVKVIKHE